MLRMVRRILAVATPILVTTLLLVAPASAALASPAAQEHCVIVVEKLKPGQTTSNIRSQTCASRPGSPQLQQTSALAGTLLIVLYEHHTYGGASTRIEGSDGPCDAAGYGISALNSTWRNRMTSFKTFNWCNVIDLYDNNNYGGAFLGGWGSATSTLSVSNVGSYANDRTNSMLLWRQ
jgi:hypothetical protein